MSANTPTIPSPHQLALKHRLADELVGLYYTQMSHPSVPEWKNRPKKRLHTYKTVEHGAGHPSCEAHVEERRGCVWMTRSLWSSSTSSAWGAGVTILPLAGASPPLVHSNPFCLLPVHSTFCTFPLFKRCFRITPWFWHPLRKTHTPPSRRARDQPCLKRAPIIMLRGGIVRRRAAALAINGFTAKKKAKVMEWHLPG